MSSNQFKSPKKPTKFLTDFCPMKLGQKSVKNLVGFLGDLKTPKIHSEINWPLHGNKGTSNSQSSIWNPLTGMLVLIACKLCSYIFLKWSAWRARYYQAKHKLANRLDRPFFYSLDQSFWKAFFFQERVRLDHCYFNIEYFNSILWACFLWVDNEFE